MKLEILKNELNKVPGILSLSHVNLLHKYSLLAKGARAEIGSLVGLSTCSIALGMGDAETLICIDPFETEYLSDMAKKVIAKVTNQVTYTEKSFFHLWEQQIKKIEPGGKIIPIIGDRLEKLNEIKSILNGSKLGLLFIDGLHSYEAVRDELIVYLPLVRENGFVIFHDYSPQENSVFSLWKAVNEAVVDGRLRFERKEYLCITVRNAYE